MECKHCNLPISEDSAFCRHCGTPIEVDITESKKRSVNDSYPIRRIGHVSRNPILFILDFLCLKIPYAKGMTVFIGIVIVHFSLHLVTSWGWYKDHGIESNWFFYSLAFIFLRIDILYRWIRHRHFKKYNEPGPYGWGTLDPLNSVEYENM